MKKLIWVLPFLLIGMVRAEVVRSVGSLIYKDNVNSRVGINTLSPSYTLDVNGGMNIVGAMTAVSSLTVTGNAFSVGGSTLVVTGGKVRLNGSTGNNALNVTPNSTGGIMVRESDDGFDAAYLNADTYHGSLSLLAGGSTKVFLAAGSEASYFTGNGTAGNLGVGTATPGATLDVHNWAGNSYALQVSSNNGTAMVSVMGTNGNVGIGNTAPDNKLHISSGTITIDGTGAPTVGYGLCLATGGKLGHCTTVLGADGTCTCTAP